LTVISNTFAWLSQALGMLLVSTTMTTKISYAVSFMILYPAQNTTDQNGFSS